MNDKLDLKTTDIVNENVAKVAELFPNCITETDQGKAIDFDLLKQELNHEIIEGSKERYRLEWPGKKEAIVTANLPTTNTLRPVPEDSVDFENTENLYIEGDNLEVLKILQESYLSKIKMIYIDPPYNTGRDFVYKDNFAVEKNKHEEESGQRDEMDNRLIQNPESSGRYHSDWLTMMYPRLKLARNLLNEKGILFVSIGENELTNLDAVLCEIFGQDNRIGIVSRSQKGGGNKGKHFNPVIDYILAYSKKENKLPFFTDHINPKIYNKTELSGLRRGEKYAEVVIYMPNLDYRPNQRFWVTAPDGERISTPHGKSFRWIESRFREEDLKGNVVYNRTNNSKLINEDGKQAKWILYQKRYYLDSLKDEKARPNNLFLGFQNMLGSKELSELAIPFDYPKPSELIKYLMFISKTNSDDLILDFFSGSATTAHAVLQLNAEDGGKLKFIMVQLPEETDESSEAYKAGYKNICEIGKERIRRAGKKILSEQKEKEPSLFENANSELDTNNSKLDIGFRVYRLDSSNMKDVYYRPQDYKQDEMDLFEDNLKERRSPMDLLTQIMLDWGLPLSLKIKELSISNKQFFQVAGNSLLACFDDGVDENFTKDIAKYKPLRLVCRDKSFTDDTAKENVKQLLKQLSPETEFKVI